MDVTPGTIVFLLCLLLVAGATNSLKTPETISCTELVTTLANLEPIPAADIPFDISTSYSLV